MKILKNNRLQIEFNDENAYTAARFDHCGIIKQVTLDGKFNFCTTQTLDDDGFAHERGIGLCNEFGLESALGYEEKLNYFVKIGIGDVVRNPDKESKMKMLLKNPQLKPEIKSEYTENSATFTLEQASKNGYAYKYEKKVVLVENKIEFYTKLINTGERFIDTSEYYHNFVNLDNEPVDENYELKVDSIPSDWADLPMGQIKVNGDTFYFEEPVNEVFYVRAHQPNSMSKWTLKSKKTGLSMSETSQNKVVKFAIWGLDHVFSTELFTDVKLNQGETYENKRTLTFSKT